MTTLREAAQAALDTLTDARIGTCAYMDGTQIYEDFKKTADTLRAALDAEPAQPFCYLKQTSSSKHPPHGWAVHFTEGDVPLYTAPQPPADVPRLSDEDFEKLIDNSDARWAEDVYMIDSGSVVDLLRAVEAEVRRRCGVVG